MEVVVVVDLTALTLHLPCQCILEEEATIPQDPPTTTGRIVEVVVTDPVVGMGHQEVQDTEDLEDEVDTVVVAMEEVVVAVTGEEEVGEEAMVVKVMEVEKEAMVEVMEVETEEEEVVVATVEVEGAMAVVGEAMAAVEVIEDHLEAIMEGTNWTFFSTFLNMHLQTIILCNFSFLNLHA